jgi:hypothetical protein
VDGIRVVEIPGALNTILRSNRYRELVEQVDEAIADNARDRAPTDPLGRSAREGIVTETVLTPHGWEGRVGHVAGAYGFWLARQEFGTRFQSPRPHLRTAARIRVRI